MTAIRKHQPGSIGERKDYSKPEVLGCTCGQVFTEGNIYQINLHWEVWNTPKGHQLKCAKCKRLVPIEIFIPVADDLQWIERDEV